MKNKQGFGLIELMIVIAIVGIFVSVINSTLKGEEERSIYDTQQTQTSTTNSPKGLRSIND